MARELARIALDARGHAPLIRIRDVLVSVVVSRNLRPNKCGAARRSRRRHWRGSRWGGQINPGGVAAWRSCSVSYTGLSCC